MNLDLGYILELEGRQRGWMRFRRQKSLAYLQRNTTWKNLSFVIQKSRSVAANLSLSQTDPHTQTHSRCFSLTFTHMRVPFLSHSHSHTSTNSTTHTHSHTLARFFFLSDSFSLSLLPLNLTCLCLMFHILLLWGRAFDLDSYWNFLYPLRCNSLFGE